MMASGLLLRPPGTSRPSRRALLQAAQLYVLLFYAPEVLHNDAALMRVLVDKHFVVRFISLLLSNSAHDDSHYNSEKVLKQAIRLLALEKRNIGIERCCPACQPTSDASWLLWQQWGVVDLSSVQYSAAMMILTGSSCQAPNERQLLIGLTCAAQDNWVVAWAPGAATDLAWEWANYKVRIQV